MQLLLLGKCSLITVLQETVRKHLRNIRKVMLCYPFLFCLEHRNLRVSHQLNRV